MGTVFGLDRFCELVSDFSEITVRASGGALRRLPRALPHHVANEMALRGDPIPVQCAYELRLANYVTEPRGALKKALAVVNGIAENGPPTLAAPNCILREVPDWPESDFFTRRQGITEPVMSSEDAREGARAFTERRPPIWRGISPRA